jgi:hypothetical protein
MRLLLTSSNPENRCEVDRNLLDYRLVAFDAGVGSKKAQGTHHAAGGVVQSEAHSRGQPACGLAAHETDGTTTCLDRAPDTTKDDTGGEAVGATKKRS